MLNELRARIARLIAPDAKGVTVGFSPNQVDFWSSGMATVHYAPGVGPNMASVFERETALATAVMAYAAIQYRAKNVSEPPLRVMVETEDGYEPVDHPLDELLDQPSPDYDMGETMELTQASLDVFGNALWVGDTDDRMQLNALRPWMGNEIRIHATGDRIFGSYEIKVDGGRWEPRDPDSVVHFRYVSPVSRHYPPSPLDLALRWLGLEAELATSVKLMMSNAMFPSVVISPHQDWNPTDDEYERFKAMIDQYHVGAVNHGKPFVALGGSKIETVGRSLADLLPDEILDRVEANVAMAFGIAPVVLGALVGLRNSPWSQMSEARRMTYEDTILPLWRKHQKVLTKQLLQRLDPRPELSIQFDTDDVVALQADRSALIADAAAATWWTLDERRVYTGQDPVGGEDGEYIEALSSPAPFMAPDADDELEADDEVMGADAPDTKALHSRSMAWAIFDLASKTAEDDLEAAAADALEELAGNVRAAMRKLGSKSITDDVIKAIEAEGVIDDVFEKYLVPEVRRTAQVAARVVSQETGVPLELGRDAAAKYARRHSAELVPNLAASTRNEYQKIIAKAIREGSSVEELSEALQRGRGLSKKRADLIARTESTAVLNGAQREVMSEYQSTTSGKVMKSWLSARDSRVRPEHQTLDDGSYIPVDQPFANGLLEPGEPNCRCTLIYRVEA